MAYAVLAATQNFFLHVGKAVASAEVTPIRHLRVLNTMPSVFLKIYILLSPVFYRQQLHLLFTNLFVCSIVVKQKKRLDAGPS